MHPHLPSLKDANLGTDGLGSQLIVARDDNDANARRLTLRNGLGDLGSGWVLKTSEANKDQAALDGLVLGGVGQLGVGGVAVAVV